MKRLKGRNITNFILLKGDNFPSEVVIITLIHFTLFIQQNWLTSASVSLVMRVHLRVGT
jgi:hypothetical protein